MAFTRSYITEGGLALLTKLETREEKLVISAVLGGNGADPGLAPSEMTEIPSAQVEFQTLEGVQYTAPNQIMIPLYYENSGLTEGVALSEIGIFAKDPDGGETLLAVAVSYHEPLALPRFAEGRLELTVGFLMEFSLAGEIEIVLPSSVVYLTRPEAMKLFWIIGEKYPATEITESVGYNTEEWQRIQDDRIEQILQLLRSGSTAGVIYERPTLGVAPYNWRILNFSGWRNPATGAIEA